jgi:hypothetical protein
MSAWKEYKQKLGTTRPWDVVNPNTEFADDEKQSTRMTICRNCPEYVKLTSQCKQCGCVMKLKTKLLYASCPLGHW